MVVLWNSIQSVLVIVIIMALGYCLEKAGWFSKNFSKNIAKLIMNIALPAAIFITVLKKLTRGKLITFSSYLLWGLLAFVIGYIVAFILVKILKVRRSRRGIFINAIVNANTIFVGLPLSMALFGSKSMQYFLVYFVLNTFSTWTFGIILINNDDPTQNTHHINWEKVFSMPLIGFVIALIIVLLNIPLLKISFINSSFTYIGALVTPLSLIYIGIVLAKAGLKSIKFNRDTIIALLGRFIIYPIIMILVMFLAKGVTANIPVLLSKTMIIQAATPMLTVLPILASNTHEDVHYATNVVTISTVLFIVVIPVLMVVLQFI